MLTKINNSNNINFGSQLRTYKVIKKESLLMPVIAVASSAVCSAGYLIGSTGLYYDNYQKSNGKIKNIFLPKKRHGHSKAENSQENIEIIFPDKDIIKFVLDKSKNPLKYKNDFCMECKPANSEAAEHKGGHEGVRTIVPKSKFAKLGLKAVKIGITASSLAGFTAGITAGIPMMSIGEAINMAAAPCIETPVGTGLFGIGIASIFSGLALENTPELLLDKAKFKAEKSLKGKVKLVLNNVKDSMKEVGSSCTALIKNTFYLFTPKHKNAVNFFKENIFALTPKKVVIKEMINKEGNVFVETMLKQPKNYLMHAASAVLAVGGGGLVLFSLLNRKKAQKKSLKVEEAGFFTDNIGMTKFGIDKLSMAKNVKDTVGGTGFFVGGIINAISQIMGIDNKQGRAAQWLGVSLVFLGFGIDRGKQLKNIIKNNKKGRQELTRAVRQWEVDLTKLFDVKKPEQKKLLKQTLKAIKTGAEIPESVFGGIMKSFKKLSGSQYEPVAAKIKGTLGANVSPLVNILENNGKHAEITNPADVQHIIQELQAQSKELFG